MDRVDMEDAIRDGNWMPLTVEIGVARTFQGGEALGRGTRTSEFLKLTWQRTVSGRGRAQKRARYDDGGM